METTMKAEHTIAAESVKQNLENARSAIDTLENEILKYIENVATETLSNREGRQIHANLYSLNDAAISVRAAIVALGNFR